MTSATHEYLPNGTRVLNTDDGEPGTIMNGYARNTAGAWVRYEVETAYGIEIWSRERMALMSDLEAAAAE